MELKPHFEPERTPGDIVDLAQEVAADVTTHANSNLFPGVTVDMIEYERVEAMRRATLREATEANLGLLQ